MTYPFPTPAIAPLHRQQVKDGLMLNAERWQRAHDYHRHRQNLHYQSINQPGIVCGLGVCPAEPPDTVAAEYRDHRWVQIQPGIAIDYQGNPIVVPHPIHFRLATELKTSEPVTVYLIVQYRDPTQLDHPTDTDVVPETFRIDERSRPPSRPDIELCRILLRDQHTQLSTPADVFFPGYGNLDFRYRRQAQTRPQGLVRLAELQHPDPDCRSNYFNLIYLLRALEGLYPSLTSVPSVAQVTWKDPLAPYELLYVTGQQALTLNAPQIEVLSHYLTVGGTLLIDAPQDATALIQAVHDLAQHLQTPLKSLQDARRDHPLRSQPFLFSQLPTGDQGQIELRSGGGIILAIGNLANTWGLGEGLSRSRTELREAQELGVNILSFAWHRKQMMANVDPGG